MRTLVINSGSSSIKYKLFRMPGGSVLGKGLIEHIGEKGSSFQDHFTGLKAILTKIDGVELVGHRVVHGAEEFSKPVIINEAVIKKIKQCCALAPLHNPANLTGILACRKLLPGIRQVAVFDTAFHQSLPEHAFIYGLPYEYYRKWGVRKYGFHGTSHQYVAHEAARILGRPYQKLRLITCHLGNGCSIACVKHGKSIDTSMGFTPLEGLIMGTRCGDIDPALVTYLMRKKKLDAQGIEDILNKSSGLKGVSGLSNDMRELEGKASRNNARARLAIDMFVYRIKKYIGAYTAVMGGCDALIFTAGIGEHQEGIRRRICKGLFDHLKQRPAVLVIPTQEELMIARQSYHLVAKP
ncbi:MAG: acetate kinase [Candidatus Omnitrophica bacterium]|nr:acetate kinase [Candidatus Omnitrophota bacterium]